MGHSVGEIAAAHVAGVLSLSDACRLVGARGRLMQALPAGGVMVAVQASEEEVVPLLVDGVSVGAVNGPRSVVLSGVAGAVESVVGRLSCRSRSLVVSHAFHSSLMDPMLDEFRAVVRELSFAEPVVSAVSTVTGQPVTSQWSDPEYWVGQVRSTVRFHDAAQRLLADDVTTLIEVGPDAILTGMLAAHLPDGVAALPTLRRDRPEPQAAAELFGHLYAYGQPVDPDTYPPVTAGTRIPLPSYPFQRERYWLLRDAATTTAVPEPKTAPVPAAVDLTGLDDDARADRLLALVRTEAATVLGHGDPSRLGADRAFTDLGFDSMTAVELRSRLSTALGITLPAIAVFDHPTPRSLAGLLLDQYAITAATATSADTDDLDLLAEVDRLDAALARNTLTADRRTAVLARLGEVLARRSPTEPGPEPELLHSADADELFAFIDDQLGRAARPAGA
ncbi:acyltransferase domain-containing protein [Micromonospora gifhornensis]|uniref:acyltransferase domain-containing protein n=2 Tax=Micromonospora gifhornensis TaxID=84594 RepID=UPI0031D3C421